MEDDEDVLDEADECERPEDEAEDAEDIVGPGVRQRERREGVQRRRPDVAVHHAQRLVPQQRQLPPRQLLQAAAAALHIVKIKKQFPLEIGLHACMDLVCIVFIPPGCGASSCTTG